MRVPKIDRKKEYLLGGGEIKATNDQQGIIEGYLNYIGNIDFGDDRTMKGAFQQTLKDSYKRKSTQGLDFLWPYLWNHDYNQLPPGGIFEADETPKGLYTKTQLNLDMQLGRELYSSFKLGTMKKQSMGYHAIQLEWTKDEATNRPIRNLLEVAIKEGSAVVFAMNDLSQVETVKRFWPGYSAKGSASGKTSWPLAERGVSWDGGQARKDIQAWATSGDTVNWSKAAQCFFWVEKSPPENMSQCKMPFVAKSGGSMKAIPAGIIACAGVISGARGGANIDDVDGVKSKIASYYSKMKMTPPWEKGATMDIWSKDYATSYMETNQQDWVAGMWKLWYPLRNEFLQAFITGNTPEEDIQKAIKQFSTAALAYVQRGIELGMTEFLQPDDDDDDSGHMPSMMSADDNPETKEVKAGRVLSAANHRALSNAVEALGKHNIEIKKTAGGIDEHIMNIRKVLSSASAASGQNRLSGYQVYGDDDPVPEQKEEEGEPTQTKEELEVDIHSLIHDLTLTLASDNANRGM